MRAFHVGTMAMFAFFLSCSSALAADDYRLTTYRFRIHQQGGFLNKIISELPSREATIAVNAACVYFTGSPCPEYAQYIKGVDYLVNGPRRTQGEAYYQDIDAEPGYEICTAQINMTTASMTGETTFNATLHQSGRKLVTYAVVPRRDAGQWVDFMLYFTLVPIGTRSQYPSQRGGRGCMAPGQVVWLCGPTSAPRGDCVDRQAGARVWIEGDR